MISCITLADIEHRIEKVGPIFNLMDFDKNGQLTQDEMVRMIPILVYGFHLLQIILLMCIGGSLGFMLGKPYSEADKIDTAVIAYGKYIYVNLGKQYTHNITREEFTNWVKANIFDKGILTMDALYQELVESPRAR